MKGVIAAGHNVTAEAGARILREGGNAFDAALAAMFASTIPEVVLSSIGDGGFLMAHGPDVKSDGDAPVLYDFFVDTPRIKRPESELDFYGIQADFGPATQEFHIGVGASATPGLVPGAYAVHGDLGSLPMPDILAPAIEAARGGVAVNDFHAYLFTIIEPILRASPEAAAYFAPDGVLLRSGDIYRNEALAHTLELLGREGPELFSRGEVGRAIIEQAERRGGHLVQADLENYTVIKRAPLYWQHGNMKLALNPAPAQSGALIAYGLGLLAAIQRRSGEGLRIEDLVQAMQLTNEARLTHGCALEDCLGVDSIKKHLDTALAATPATRGTTQISVIDGRGNAASITVSNGEGCGHMVGKTGFMLNNMLGEEDLNPGGFHKWEPDTRLSTMMCPMMAQGGDGRIIALGSGGSNRIRTALLQVLHHLIDHDMPLEAAVEHPRVHLELDGVLSYENLFSPETHEQFVAAFPDAHPWPDYNMFFGGVHSVERDADGTVSGVGDPRRGGVAIVVE